MSEGAGREQRRAFPHRPRPKRLGGEGTSSGCPTCPTASQRLASPLPSGSVSGFADELGRGDEPCIAVAIGAAGTHEVHDGEAFLTWDDHEPKRPSDVPFPE